MTPPPSSSSSSAPDETANDMRGSTRIVWCVRAEHLASQAEHLFPSQIHGICIESFFSYREQTLQFLQQCAHWYQEHQQPMPALMLSLSASQHYRVSQPKQDKALAYQDTVWIFSSLHRDHEPSVAEYDQAQKSNATIICVSTDLFLQCVKPSDTLYLGYGDCALETQSVDERKLVGVVQHSGVVTQGMALYLPEDAESSAHNLQNFDTQTWIDAGINYIILPGCFSATLIQDFRHTLPRDHEASPWLIYRIDSQESLKTYSTLEQWIDGAMISRKQLSLTANPDLVPILTKELLNRCRSKAKLGIVSSQMLGSMQHNITPTRAEVSDIANAVYDGADAVMLSEYTLQGPYAQDAARLAQKIIADAESYMPSFYLPQRPSTLTTEQPSEMDVICTQAVTTASRIQAKALVCITKTGNTAIRLSSLDTHLPIIAITFCERICRKLRLLRGVIGMVLKTNPQLDEVLPRVNELLKTTGWLHKGDSIVFVTVTLSSMSHEASNLFTIQSIY